MLCTSSQSKMSLKSTWRTQRCQPFTPIQGRGRKTVSAVCVSAARQLQNSCSGTQSKEVQHTCSNRSQLKQELHSNASTISMPLLMAGLAIGLVMVDPAHAETPLLNQTTQHAVEQFQLAENQEFWGNVVRYGRYFVTVMLGTGYVMLRPLAGAFKNPVSAILTIGGVAGFVYFVKFTLEAMLGLSSEPFDYVQGQF